MKALLIEDELDLSSAVAKRLRAAGYVVDAVACLDTARAALSTARYAVVLLDRRLPDGEGLSLIPMIRNAQPGTPVLVLSALDAVCDRIRGLDGGADDYLTKPIDGEELLARLRAALRRPGAGGAPPILCGRLRYDVEARDLSVDGRPLVLKRRELALLETLMTRAGRVVRREVLIDTLYGFDDEIQSNTLDAHVSRLRARLREADAGVVIHPVRGVGYVLDMRAP